MRCHIHIHIGTLFNSNPHVLTTGRHGAPIKTELSSSSLFSSYRVDLGNGVGEEFDIVAPAENLKQLFKIPYSKARVSLAVHKIGKSLVLDGLLDEEAALEELVGQQTL